MNFVENGWGFVWCFVLVFFQQVDGFVQLGYFVFEEFLVDVEYVVMFQFFDLLIVSVVVMYFFVGYGEWWIGYFCLWVVDGDQ